MGNNWGLSRRLALPFLCNDNLRKSVPRRRRILPVVQMYGGAKEAGTKAEGGIEKIV